MQSSNHSECPKMVILIPVDSCGCVDGHLDVVWMVILKCPVGIVKLLGMGIGIGMKMEIGMEMETHSQEMTL